MKTFPPPLQTAVDTNGVKVSVPWSNWFSSLTSPFMFIDAPGSAFSVNAFNGNLQKFITNANTTITLPPSVAGQEFTLLVTYGGVHTLTFAGGGVLLWAGGVAPTATSVLGQTDAYSFISDGVSTFGSDAGRNY